MTRDEAIDAFHKLTYPDSSWNTVGWERDRAWSRKAIDGFVALGMLKLDEPKSARTKTLDALFKHFGASDIESIIGLLDEAGLKIVEK